MGKIATGDRIKATYSRILRIAEFISKVDKSGWVLWDGELLESVRHKDGSCIFIPMTKHRLFICNGFYLEAGKRRSFELMQLANSITKHNCLNMAYIWYVLDKFVEEVF